MGQVFKLFLTNAKSLAILNIPSMLINKLVKKGASITMKKVLLLSLSMLMMITACATKRHESAGTISLEKSKKIEKPAEEPPKTTGIVVDAKDLQILESMNKAVELYVLKSEIKQFTSLCKDTHFDCFIDEKSFPKRKKKITRTIPPYASGSKMGLQGEKRVQVKYDFYP